MKKTCLVAMLVVLIGLSLPAKQAQRTITAAEAKQHIGEPVTVCGKVLSPKFAATTKGQPTYLNLDQPYPNAIFTVVIWGTDRAKFGEPEIKFRDKNICATGTIRDYRGTPEIVATDPKQIVLLAR